jgi:hypothetical protein
VRRAQFENPSAGTPVAEIEPTITATFKHGPLNGSSIEAEVVEGRPPKTSDVSADDGSGATRLAGWVQSGRSAVYTFLYRFSFAGSSCRSPLQRLAREAPFAVHALVQVDEIGRRARPRFVADVGEDALPKNLQRAVASTVAATCAAAPGSNPASTNPRDEARAGGRIRSGARASAHARALSGSQSVSSTSRASSTPHSATSRRSGQTSPSA